MHYLRCIHPPGGGNGAGGCNRGRQRTPPRFEFVLTPVLLNALTILLVAVMFNLPFRGGAIRRPWRNRRVGHATPLTQRSRIRNMSSDTENASPGARTMNAPGEHEHLYGHRGARPDDARRTSTAVRHPTRYRFNRGNADHESAGYRSLTTDNDVCSLTHFGRTTHQRLTRR